MEDKQKISEASNSLVAGGLALTLFWVLNILKTAYPEFGGVLGFYKPIGPLLGLFVISIIFFRLLTPLLNKGVKRENQKFAFWFFAASIALFALMVFPPIFEAIAHLF